MFNSECESGFEPRFEFGCWYWSCSDVRDKRVRAKTKRQSSGSTMATVLGCEVDRLGPEALVLEQVLEGWEDIAIPSSSA